MAAAGITEDQIAALLPRIEEAANALLQGDVERYLELIGHTPGFTLMPPFGGRPRRYDDRDDRIRRSTGLFHGGEAKIELEEVHAWGDTLVVAMIERQHAQVGGLPDQDWSLRVTQVYRRNGSDWELVHRHADPLAHGIDLEQAAALARG